MLATGATAGANSLFDFDPGRNPEIRTFISTSVTQADKNDKVNCEK